MYLPAIVESRLRPLAAGPRSTGLPLDVHFPTTDGRALILMHLKAYEIDGAFLRTGSANFSTSGENAQDNDLIVIRGAGAAAKFDAHFERMWDAAQPLIEFAQRA